MTSQHPGDRSDELGPLPDAPEPHQQESASAPLQPDAAGSTGRESKAEASEHIDLLQMVTRADGAATSPRV